jgi:hypothetical protein
MNDPNDLTCACPCDDAVRCIEIRYPEVYDANEETEDGEWEECQCSCHDNAKDYDDYE